MAKRILHLEASGGWGGQEMRLIEEASGMRQRGYQIFFAVQKGGKIISELKKAAFPVLEIDFQKWAWPISFLKLLLWIRKNQIDIINTHSSLDSWLGGFAGRVLKKKIIRTRHLSTPIKKGINSKVLYGKLADYVVTTCEIAAKRIREQTKKNAQFCLSIPTGVDPNKLETKKDKAKEFRSLYRIQEDEILVGLVTFMRSWKGVNDFLIAAKKLETEKQMRFVIIGGGYEEGYRKFARDLGLDNLIFTGHMEDPIPAIAALDVFVLLSAAHEGVSQAAIQAACLGKPLITTPTGGLCEVCIDNVTGIQVPIFSSDDVVKAIVKLKENPGLRQKLGQKARELVLEKFTYQKMLDKMEFIYKQLSIS